MAKVEILKKNTQHDFEPWDFTKGEAPALSFRCGSGRLFKTLDCTLHLLFLSFFALFYIFITNFLFTCVLTVQTGAC